MGLIRKMTSVATVGAIDFRSDKERTARNTGKVAKYERKAAKAAKRAGRR